MKERSRRPVARCFSNGEREIQVAYFNGYDFGDKLLEGVSFMAELLPDGFMEVSTAPGSASYMNNLNEGKWLKEAVRHASECDIFYERENFHGDEFELKDLW